MIIRVFLTNKVTPLTTRNLTDNEFDAFLRQLNDKERSSVTFYADNSLGFNKDNYLYYRVDWE